MFLNKNNTLKWKWIAIAVGTVAALCLAGIFWLDAPLYFFLRRFDGAWAHIIGAVTSFKVWVIATAIAYAIAVAIKSTEHRAQSIDNKKFKLIPFIKRSITKFKYANNYALCSMLCALLLSGAVGWILKFSLGRMRPVFLEELEQVGFYPFTSDWAFNSMPSGHATASFAALVMIGLMFPRFKWATWTLAVIIGVSRVAVGAHFPSDVLLGAFIGMVAADLIVAARR
ncbi:MAG: phosphatase PAP2 family protein [Alphaproteobacteria bacterium]|nr:phosphatase PAP2 family protein [Alphaproteobacteria bacterium]